MKLFTTWGWMVNGEIFEYTLYLFEHSFRLIFLMRIYWDILFVSLSWYKYIWIFIRIKITLCHSVTNIRVIFDTNIHSFNVRIVWFHMKIFGYSFISFFIRTYSDTHSYQNQYEFYTLVGTLRHMIILAFDVCHYLILEHCSIYTVIVSQALCRRSSFNPWCDVHGILFLKTSYVSLI